MARQMANAHSSVYVKISGLWFFNSSITARKTVCCWAPWADLFFFSSIRILHQSVSVVAAFQTGGCLSTLELLSVNQTTFCWSFESCSLSNALWTIGCSDRIDHTGQTYRQEAVFASSSPSSWSSSLSTAFSLSLSPLSVTRYLITRTFKSNYIYKKI